ncbi:DNA polymerase III subunit gamma/tau [Candidatus Peregrinibacteria bacterium]|nr:DNA polymerase III subunit gamma/tau [Candidatus Peregrinibacteria bacterium]
MSLYRKYRPKTFAEVVGQEHIVTTLEQAVLQDKLSHAYLFSGPRGTGKTSIARILAKMLLTRGVGDEKIQKQILRAVEEESLVDLLEIDAASYTQVDNIRDLIEKIQFSPVVASAKVYIIDEVHMLSKSAFNALLKTLEEPPAYAYFILATTELNKVPATIQSRCQRFPFRAVREEDIIRHLQFIADQEKIPIDRGALRAVAHHAQGGMRDAISLLDQLRSLEKIEMQDVRERIGESGQEFIEAILEAVAAGDKKELLEIVRKVEESGIALDMLLRQLLAEVRQQLHASIESNHPIERLSLVLDTLLSAIRDIRMAPVPGLVLESALLSFCEETEAPKAEKPAGLFGKRKKAEEMEAPKPTIQPSSSRMRGTGLPARPAGGWPAGKAADLPGKKEFEPAEAHKEAIVEAPEVSLEAVKKTWANVLEGVTPASVKMSLKNGRVHAVSAKTVTVSFASAFHRDKVATTDASRKVEEIFEKFFKRHLKLECVVQDETGIAPSKDDKMVNLAEAAAEIF